MITLNLTDEQAEYLAMFLQREKKHIKAAKAPFELHRGFNSHENKYLARQLMEIISIEDVLETAKRKETA